MNQTNQPNDETFITRLREVVRKYPRNAAVVVDGSTILSYAELWRAAGEMAGRLKEQGIGRESVVGICLPKSAHTIVSVVGVWRAGAAWIPIEPSLPDARIQFLASDSGAELVIDSASEILPSLPVGPDESVKSVAPADDTNFDHLDDLAYIIYTSGTTGQPKGVEITHRGLVRMLEQQIDVLGLGPESRSLFLLSPSFDASVSDIGTALLSGASIWIETKLSRNGRFAGSPDQLLELIAEREITYVDLPPAVLAKLDPNHCPDSLKTILVGGEVCSQEAVSQWAKKVRLINVYGPTEATVCTSLSVCSSETWNRNLIGQPLAGVEYQIVLEANSDKPNQGELLISGSSLARGYRNRPELTKEKFFKRGRKRFYRTGDIVRRDPDGEYVFVGRVDRQLKIRGHRIEPGEIESTLVRHPDVDRALALGKSRILWAFIETNSEADEKTMISQLRTLVRSNLPEYCVPQRFVLMDSIPLTTTGKIDISQLEKSLKAHNEVPTLPEDRSSNERLLTNVFTEVLGHSNFSSTDHFFDVGGDSLGIMEVCVLARQRGLTISPETLVAAGSVNRICESFEADSGSRKENFKSASELRADVEAILRSNQDRTESASDSDELALNDWQPLQQSTLLLTGATGFLGVRILSQLLTRSPEKIICLVRGSNDQQARQRLLNLLKVNNIRISSHDWDKIDVLSGDISRRRFGWPDRQYETLANQVNGVIHSAAQVNTVLPYETLRHPNVLGTNEVAEFAAHGLPKKLEYISTLSVFVGTDQFTGLMQEGDDLSKTQRVYGGHAQSKWAAEYLLRQRATGHFKTRIYRLGLLTSDTRTGRFPQDDLLTLTIQGVIELGAVPSFDRQLTVDITPVDYAAETLVALMEKPTREHTFHIAHPTGLSAENLFRNLRALYPHVRQVPDSEFADLTHDSNLNSQTASACLAACLALSRQLHSDSHLAPVPTDLFQATNTQFDMKNSNMYLRETGRQPPELNDEFVRQMIRDITSQEMAAGIGG